MGDKCADIATGQTSHGADPVHGEIRRLARRDSPDQTEREGQLQEGGQEKEKRHGQRPTDALQRRIDDGEPFRRSRSGAGRIASGTGRRVLRRGRTQTSQGSNSPEIFIQCSSARLNPARLSLIRHN